ncbi:hypothetical protein LTR66_014956, partial [Elasticomyces elasticus]
MSESHIRKMMNIGSDSRNTINEFSNDFKRDFVQLLRTGHGTKSIIANQFYQEYISNKSHVHMNSTKWNSLTEFCKYLGREGICRVDIDEKNEERGGATALMISWIDNSPEALRRQEALKKREAQDKGDEFREQKMIEQQRRRALEQAGGKEQGEDVAEDQPAEGIGRIDGEKIKLNFGAKKAEVEADKLPSPPLTDSEVPPEGDANEAETTEIPPADEKKEPEPESKMLLKLISLAPSKPKNVFAAAGKKNAFSGAKKLATVSQAKPISEAERIMKEELERKRQREER